MCVKVAWVWQPGTQAKSYWLEEKRDGLQYTIDEIAEKHNVLHLAPTGEEPEQVGYKYLYRSPIAALSALKEFDPDIINLNGFGSPFNREIATKFINPLITLYDHGFHMTCQFSELVDVFFTPLEYRRELIAQRSGVPIETVVLNPHGYDSKLFFPDSSVEKTYTGVMVGDFKRNKNQGTIIHNWKSVEGKLLLVGRTYPPQGEPDYVEECRALIESLGLSDRVEIHDFVPQCELPKLINSAEIGIHASFTEGTSRAVTEMMACGLPMVVLNTCKSNVELIQEGGLQAEPVINGSVPYSIGWAVNQLKNDTGLYKKVSEASRRAIEPYTYERMLATFKDVIESA